MGRVFYCALPAVAKLTLLALVDHAHDDGTEIYAGQRRIARKVGCSERTVRRVVEKLETDGWLIATPRLGSRGTNRYRIALEKLPDVPTVDRTSSGRPAKMADRPNDAVRGAVDRPNTPRRPDTAMSAEPTTKKKKQPTETRRMRLPGAAIPPGRTKRS
jgi:biotin operon repressor